MERVHDIYPPNMGAQAIAAYERMQSRISAFKAQGLPPPEYLLNGAHNLIASAMLLKQRGHQS